ncbi:MAG: L,D-transpeptidase [Desulfobaccales bacterium]
MLTGTRLEAKKLLFMAILWLIPLLIPGAAAAEPELPAGKVIWIDQTRQVGRAYEDGKKIMEFPVLTGDDETTTPPGVYRVRQKVEDYFSRKYQVPMPYSLFFDLKHRRAIHEGEVPPAPQRREYATHGCVHVESPYIERLFDWAEEGTTLVIITGWRTEE